MRARTRRFIAFAVALGLSAGVLAVTAGAASAAPLEKPRAVVGESYRGGSQVSS